LLEQEFSGAWGAVFFSRISLCLAET
jgi:hypothetical protein